MKTEISQSTSHLAPIGTLRSVGSELYGSYTMRCVANIDNFPKGFTFDEHMKMHAVFQKLNGVAHMMVNDESSHESRYFSLFVAIDVDNKIWFKENKTCPYAQKTGGKQKSLPVAASEKEIQKILKNVPLKFIVVV